MHLPKLRAFASGILCIITFFTAGAPAQSAQDSTDSTGSFVFLPILYHTPETDLAYGIMLQYNFREANSAPASRPSVIMPIVIYTQKNQFIGQLSYELYYNDELYHFFGNIGYLFYPNSYWGIGNNTPEENEEKYTSTGFQTSNTFLTPSFLPISLISVVFPLKANDEVLEVIDKPSTFANAFSNSSVIPSLKYSFSFSVPMCVLGIFF